MISMEDNTKTKWQDITLASTSFPLDNIKLKSEFLFEKQLRKSLLANNFQQNFFAVGDALSSPSGYCVFAMRLV